METKVKAEGWANVPLESLITFALGGDWGKDPESKLENYTDVYCIRGAEFRHWERDKGHTASLRQVKETSMASRKIRENDILVEISGGGPEQPVGRTVLIDKECLSYKPEIPKIATNFLRLIRPSQNVNAKYLNLYLKYFYKSGEVVNYQAGSNNLRNLKFNDYLGIEIPLAPENEQSRIVEKIEELFSELDSGIKSLTKAKQQLSVYRQALLKQAFEGKLTAQWREDNPDKLESPGDTLERLKRERDERYQQKLDEWKVTVNQWKQDSSQGKKPSKPRKPKAVTQFNVDLPDFCQELPDSWFWDKLGHMTLAVEYGTSAKSSESGRVPVLRMGNIQNTKFDWDDLVFTSDEDEISKYILNAGDVLFNRTNSPELVGKTAKYNGEREALFAGYLIRVNHFDNFVNSDYLNLFLNSYVSKRYGNSVKTDGVNQSNINGEKLSNYPFPYCSLAEQEQVVQILEEKISKIERSESEISMNLKKAELLRQSILKKAFSGQLVPQDPEDEPASELLKKIAIEKEELAEKDKAEKAAARKKKSTAKKTVKS